MKVIGYVSHERLESCYGKLLVMKILKRLNHKCLVFTFNNVFIANMGILIARKIKVLKEIFIEASQTKVALTPKLFDKQCGGVGVFKMQLIHLTLNI